MRRSQHRHLKCVLKSLPHKYYSVVDIWEYCNSLAIDSKKHCKIIESPAEIIEYVMKKTETLKGRDSWDYRMMNDIFCISFIKPISKHNISYAVAMKVLD